MEGSIVMETERLEVNNAEFLPHVFALVNQGKHVTIPLKGFSMNPWLVGGRDKAVLVRIDHPIEVNDVVLAELSPGRYALHRVLHVDENRIQMLGDGNLTPDPVIPLSAVKAKVLGVYRKGCGQLQTMDNHAYIIYYKWWMRFRPVRRWLLAFYRHLIMPKKYKISR